MAWWKDEATVLVRSLAEAKGEVVSLKGLLARAKSEATRLRASLIDMEGEATKLKEEKTKLQGSFIEDEEKASFVEHWVFRGGYRDHRGLLNEKFFFPKITRILSRYLCQEC